jgi:hypothetical protein
MTPRVVKKKIANTSQQATTTTCCVVATDCGLRSTVLSRVIATGNATRTQSKQAAKPDLANNRERAGGELQLQSGHPTPQSYTKYRMENVEVRACG